MTSRSTSLIFASLLLVASLAGAATPMTATHGAPSFMAPAASSPDCAKTDLPFLAPAPTTKAGGAPCGSCSEAVCAGYTTGTVCGFRNGHTYTCQDVYGGTCGGSPVTLICNCWYGPLP